jgi:hypothetical protein
LIAPEKKGMNDLHRFTAEPGADVQQSGPAKSQRSTRIEWPYLIICASFFLMGAVMAHLIGW